MPQQVVSGATPAADPGDQRSDPPRQLLLLERWAREPGNGCRTGSGPGGWNEAVLKDLCEIRPGPPYTRLPAAARTRLGTWPAAGRRYASSNDRTTDPDRSSARPSLADKKAQVSDLGLSHGAGDENRTRALSLGSEGASRVRPPLTCGYVFWSAFSATCSAPLFTVVVRSYGHAVGTRLVGAASRRAAGHLAMRNAWRGSTAATVTCVCTLLTEDAKIARSVSLGTDFDLRRRQPGVLGEEAADVVDRDGARKRRGCCGPARSAPAGPGAVAGHR